MSQQLMPVREGLLLGILTVAFGWGLGVAFGGAEDVLKGGLKASAEESLALYVSKSGGDEAAARASMAAIVEKAWAYYQRAHLHGGAIGSVVIGLCLALAHVEGRRGLRRIASLLLGLGGLGYSSFWMLAAWRAPGLASTGAAKESLFWLATPTAGALVVGLALALGLLVASLYGGEPREAQRRLKDPTPAARSALLDGAALQGQEVVHDHRLPGHERLAEVDADPRPVAAGGELRVLAEALEGQAAPSRRPRA